MSFLFKISVFYVILEEDMKVGFCWVGGKVEGLVGVVFFGGRGFG